MGRKLCELSSGCRVDVGGPMCDQVTRQKDASKGGETLMEGAKGY